MPHTQGSLFGLRGLGLILRFILINFKEVAVQDDPLNLIRVTPVEEAVIIPDVYIKNATLIYQEHVLFSQLNFHLPAGKWIVLLGPSGIGKSSLLRIIAGLITPSDNFQGEVSLSNNASLQSQIAYMGQTDWLLPWLTVLENTLIACKLRHYSSTELAAKINQAKILLASVGLDHALHLYPQQLSGGMRQRAALVRTLMENKPIVLMDEPFSSLDAITRHTLQNLAAELLQDKTVLLVTHDPTESLRLGNEIYIMQQHPAIIKHIMSLDSVTPRELGNVAVTQHQALLFQELIAATGKSS